MIDAPVNGMTWGWTGERGTWTTPEAEHSMSEMLGVGVNWVAIAFAAVQDTAQSTQIPFADAPTVTDDELRGAIRAAKTLGLKVCLKPVVNVADGTWRAFISFFSREVPGEPSWTDWFDAYRTFIVHYAQIAEEESCELFCIGCEMVMTDPRESEWRSLIAEVRKVYTGPLTYNCDKYQEDRLGWWDAVDVISSSGYYRSGDWELQLDRIGAVVRAIGKPFLFLEAGCPSRAGSAQRPNDWSHLGVVSLDEQRNYYQEMLSACAGRDWIAGFMLWDWPAVLYTRADGVTDGGYCIYGKPAGDVVARFFAR